MERATVIEEVVRRLAGYFRPEQIYLFGSSARGQAHQESDIDLLVVLPDSAPKALLLSGREYELLSGIPLAVDVVPMRRSTFEARKEWLMSLPALALREGRLVYDAKTKAA
ncbi:MAG: nucleotidyltransferase domain-containing protein [Acidobacteria bacterium]|nr:nucleotidyltransferase domain-containing protein [Acidobacteriota bacterium]